MTLQVEAAQGVRCYHGTTEAAWADILVTGFKPTNLLKFVRAIEDEFGLPRGSVWKGQAWSKSRRKAGTDKHFYVTTHFEIAESYSHAGSAPLYDALQAAYRLLHPERLKGGFFPYWEGEDRWIVEQITARGGRPVVIEFDVPLAVALQSAEGQEFAAASEQYGAQSRFQGMTLGEQFQAWLASRDRDNRNDAELGFAPAIAADLRKYVTRITVGERPRSIRPRGAGLNGDLPVGLRLETDRLGATGPGSGRVTAWDDQTDSAWHRQFGIGMLAWNGEGEIVWAQVYEPYQRRGVATAMLAEARKTNPAVHHSSEQTPEAKAWSQRAATRTPPPGLTFERADYTGYGCMKARLRGEEVAVINWEADTGEVSWIVVFDAYQRMGIGTALYNAARKSDPRVHHSDNLTPEGISWSRTTDGPAPRLDDDDLYHAANLRVAAQSRPTPEVYTTLNREVRPKAERLDEAGCITLAAKVLMGERFPGADMISVVPHPKANTSAIAWDFGTNPPIPVLALSANMQDELTVIHECAHFVRNGPTGFTMMHNAEIAHDDLWFQTFHRLLRKYAPPKLWRTFEWAFDLRPEDRVASILRGVDSEHGRAVEVGDASGGHPEGGRAAARRTAGPASGRIRRERVLTGVSGRDARRSRPVEIEGISKGEFARLDKTWQKQVAKALRDLQDGKAQVEQKERPPLQDCFSIRVGDNRDGFRVVFFIGIDGKYHVFYLGFHDYKEAERRMGAKTASLPPGYVMEVHEKDKTNPALGDAWLEVTILVKHSGKPVAALGVTRSRSVAHREEPDAPFRVKAVQVYEDHQRQGIATAMYAELHRRYPGVPVEHSGGQGQSSDAQALNDALRKKFGPQMHLGAYGDSRGGTVYRGIRVPIPAGFLEALKFYEEIEEKVERRSEKAGAILLAAISKTPRNNHTSGIGIHWTERPQFACGAADAGGGAGPDWLRVVIEATYTAADVVPEGDDLYGLSGVWMESKTEAEVLIKPGASLTVTGLWVPTDPLGNYSQPISVDRCPKEKWVGGPWANILGRPVRKTAAAWDRSGHLYRGYQVDFPPDIEAEIRRLTAGAMEVEEIGQEMQVGPLVLEYLMRGHQTPYGKVNLGRHWTSNRHMAEIAASQGAPGKRWGVILEIKDEGQESDPDAIMQGRFYQDSQSEQETNLRPGTPVTVTGVYFNHSVGVVNRGENLLPGPLRKVAEIEQRWFHGSNSNLKPGDVLATGKALGWSNHPEDKFPESDDYVHFTNDPLIASYFGSQVYEVEPLGTHQMDPKMHDVGRSTSRRTTEPVRIKRLFRTTRDIRLWSYLKEGEPEKTIQALEPLATTALVKNCTCCGGTGEHDTGGECQACDASGEYDGGPIPCIGTIPDKTAARGDYYRLHTRSKPWSLEPTSQEFKRVDFKQVKVGPIKKGYSCFDNPWHLWDYVMRRRWDFTDVAVFGGRKSSQKGVDDEPLVTPSGPPKQHMTWHQFVDWVRTQPMGEKPSWKMEGFVPRADDTWGDPEAYMRRVCEQYDKQEGIRLFGSRTAGARGDLPEALVLRYTDLGKEGYIGAFVPNPDRPGYERGMLIGALSWFTKPKDGYQVGEINFVHVEQEWQRRGIAKAMLDEARKHDPRVTHSTIRTDEGEAWARQQGAAPRRERYTRTAALSLEDTISVAEEAMERGGQAGKVIEVPEGHGDDPAYRKAIEPLERLVGQIVGQGMFRKVYASDYTLDRERAQAMVTSSGSIVLRPRTTTMTLLHECAHVINNTQEGEGHDAAFARTLRDLYAKHISPAAAETFWNLVGPKVERTASLEVEAGYSALGPLPISKGRVWYRVHYLPRGWSHGMGPDVTSAPFQWDHVNQKPKYLEFMRQEGYSAFDNPRDLKKYMDMQGWSPEDPKSRVVIFTGHQVGMGRDNEPLVIPDGKRNSRVLMTWREFTDRLKDTPERTRLLDVAERHYHDLKGRPMTEQQKQMQMLFDMQKKMDENPAAFLEEMGRAAAVRRSAALAGLNGGLPEGLTFKRTEGSGWRHVDAEVQGEWVGMISWATHSWDDIGEINDVEVAEGWQRRGIATALLAEARTWDPRVHHSTNLTGDGKAWSGRVAAADTHDGVMIALTPPLEVCKALTAHDAATEALDNQHVTLVYLGKTSEVNEADLHEAVARWAEESQPIRGRVAGYGAFLNEDSNVLYAAWDLPGATGWREGLLSALKVKDIDVSENHGWTPHQTLAYEDEPITTLPPMPDGLPEEVIFGSVVVAYGGDWTSYTLKGTPPEE